MNSYFYGMWIPLQIITALAVYFAVVGSLTINWWIVFIAWFAIGPIGLGVGFHRLFSHRQFETWRWVEILLAFLGTFAAYAPLIFWAALHQKHHKISDTPEDPSSPTQYGFFESFFTYRMRANITQKVDIRNYCVKRAVKDPFLKWISANFFIVNWTVIILLAFISPSLLLSIYLLPVFIEHARVNVISSMAHMNVPFSYRNYNTPDTTYNNVIIGYLTMGFGWHNNHHNNSRELINTHRWWELDIEGIIGKLLSKKTWSNLLQ